MSHGANCDCPICSLGKKMGMIKKQEEKTSESHDQHDEHNHEDKDHHCEHC